MNLNDVYQSKRDLQRFNSDEIKSLVKKYQIDDKLSINDQLWMIAISIIFGKHNAQMPVDIDKIPEEMIDAICTQADIPTLQRFVATSKKYRRICESILNHKINAVKVVTTWYNERKNFYPPRTPELTWQEVYKLARIQLTHLFDKLKSVPPEIGELVNLESLILGPNNDLTTIPAEIGRLTNLRELLLWGNELIDIPPELGNLAKLEKLLLSGNNLSNIPPELGNLVALKELLAWGNALTHIPPELGNLVNLKQLLLMKNNLKTLPSTIGNLTKLEKLWLQDNELTTLPRELETLTQLKDLKLSGNPLDPKVIEELKVKLPNTMIS